MFNVNIVAFPGIHHLQAESRLRPRVLENQEILEKCQIWLKTCDT